MRSLATSNAMQWALVTGQQEPAIVMTATWLPGLRLSRVVLNFSCKGLLSQWTPSHSFWNFPAADDPADASGFFIRLRPMPSGRLTSHRFYRLWQTYVEKIQVCSPNQSVDFPSITLSGLNVMGCWVFGCKFYEGTMVSIPLVRKCACDCCAIWSHSKSRAQSYRKL